MNYLVAWKEWSEDKIKQKKKKLRIIYITGIV